MTNGLSPEARAILDAARDGDEPTAADRARVGRAMMAAVGGGVAVTASSTASAATAATSGAAGATATATGGAVAVGSAGILKVVAVLLAVGATAGAVAVEPWAAPEPTPPPAAESATGTAASRAPVERTVQPPAEPPAPTIPIQPAPRAAPAPEPGSPQVDRPRVRRARPARPPMATPRAPVAGPEVPEGLPSGDLEAELRLLRASHAAHRGGDATAALRLLAEHGARFPDGVLAAEREGSRVLLLCEGGSGGEAAEAFLARHPASPLAPRIRARCEDVAGELEQRVQP